MCNLFRNNYWRIQNTNCLSHKVATTHTAGKLMLDKEKEGQMFSKRGASRQSNSSQYSGCIDISTAGWHWLSTTLPHLLLCSSTPKKKAIGRVQGGSKEAPKKASNGKTFAVCEIISFGVSVLNSRKRPCSLQDGPQWVSPHGIHTLKTDVCHQKDTVETQENSMWTTYGS